LDLANYNAKEHSIINDLINGKVFRIMDNRDKCKADIYGWKLNQVQNFYQQMNLK
jgi:calcineurin-like phosphoesterase family protein